MDSEKLSTGKLRAFRLKNTFQDGGRIVIDRLDHLVLTVRSIDVSIAFYSEVLGMEAVTFGDQGRKALTFGNSKVKTFF